MEKALYSFKIDCLPPSVNHLYRTTWRTGRPLFYKEPKVKEFEQIAGWQLKKIKTPLSGELTLHAIFTFAKKTTYQRRDLDNLLKLTCDALTTNGIIGDDNQLVRIICEKELGKEDSVVGDLFD